jgi:hypothetical protein
VPLDGCVPGATLRSDSLLVSGRPNSDFMGFFGLVGLANMGWVWVACSCPVSGEFEVKQGTSARVDGPVCRSVVLELGLEMFDESAQIELLPATLASVSET